MHTKSRASRAEAQAIYNTQIAARRTSKIKHSATACSAFNDFTTMALVMLLHCLFAFFG